MFNPEKALQTLYRFDRLLDNSDRAKLEPAVLEQMQREGLLRLSVFICPKFNPNALRSTTPEKYMPAEAGPDLFEPRIIKIAALRRELLKAGLLTELNIIIGDNDAEEYIFRFIDELTLDSNIYRQRQSAYRLSFEQRCQRQLAGNAGVVVWSLAESNVRLDELEPVITTVALEKEIKFFRWLFSPGGPYRGSLNFSEATLVEMTKLKYQLYGAQGNFLEMLGGILLQTEGPGLWLERTEMLRCTGSPAIPAIYPWIRKNELIV